MGRQLTSDNHNDIPFEEPVFPDGRGGYASVDSETAPPSSAAHPSRIRTVVLAAGSVAVVITVVCAWFVLRPDSDGASRQGATPIATGSNPQQSGPTAVTTTATDTPVATTMPSAEPARSAITFDAMRAAATRQYSDLPRNTSSTWARLDSTFRASITKSAYDEFWDSIASVTLMSVAPRDATSIVVRLDYVRRDGGTDTEDRWLGFDNSGGELLIHPSERIGSVY